MLWKSDGESLSIEKLLIIFEFMQDIHVDFLIILSYLIGCAFVFTHCKSSQQNVFF